MTSSRLPKKRRGPAPSRSGKSILRNPWALGSVALVAVVGVILLIVLVAASGGGGTTPAVIGGPCSDGSVPTDGRICGSNDAPVTVEEVSDYQCPACGYFVKNMEQQLVDEYVKTGKVKLEFHNFAFLDNGKGESQDAAQAAECANDQGRFWEYHYKLFNSQNGENKGTFSKANLKKFASDLGLDRTQFDECLDSGKYATLVAEEKAAASNAGVNSTPSFIVNGDTKNIIRGADYTKLKSTIDAALANKGQ